MRYKALLPVLVAAALIGSAASRAEAYALRAGDTIVAILGASRGHSVAYDSTNKVYLVVSTMGLLRGRFVSADGIPVGAAFIIQASLNYTHFPRVAFSPDADGGAGAFLVTWHESDQASGTSVHARLVSYARGGAFGADTQLGVGSYWEAGPAVAYATGSKEFLVAWKHQTLHDLVIAQVSNSALMLARTTIPTADGERDPSLAYNPTTDKFLLVYTGWGAIGAFAQARLVQAGTGAVGEPVLLGTSSGTYITDATYNTATNQYLAAWYAPAASFGRVVNADGTVSGSVLTLSTRWKAYDALGVDFNPRSGTFFLVSHSDTAEVGGVELNTNAVAIDNGSYVTAAGGSGNFYPRIAASTDQPDWLVSMSHEFQSTMIQRLSGSAGGAPPPPPCSYSVVLSATSVAAVPGSGTATVTASASTCGWSAASSASWLTLSAGSGTGSGTVTFSHPMNGALQGRSATLTVAGQSFTITQRPNLAAVHDVDGDRVSDLVWHHQTHGELAVWELQGSQVSAAYYLLNRQPVDTSWKVAGSGDLNADGYADLVWRQVGTGRLAAWLLQGTTVLWTQGLIWIDGTAAVQTDVGWEIRAVGDLNGDGQADLIWQHAIEGTLAVWFMDGVNVAASTPLSVSHMLDPAWKIAGAADINRDGRADIVWQNHTTGSLAAWLMNGSAVGVQSRLSHSVADVNWRIRGAGDINGDGMADLIWQNISNGKVGVWYLSGFTVVAMHGVMFGTSPATVPDTDWHIIGPG